MTQQGMMSTTGAARSSGRIARAASLRNALGNPGFARAFGWIFSIALVVVILIQLRAHDMAGLAALIPADPPFWLAFIGSYLVIPFADWIIFRRLWGLPVAGLAPLFRKTILNSVVLSYSGEAYFFEWARRQSGLTDQAFGAVKDVAILSALVGNAATLFLVLLAWPMLAHVQLGIARGPLVASIAVLLTISLATILLRKRVFHLGMADLAFVTLVHLARTVLSVGLIALMWHLALPAVALEWWLLLSTGRMVISRLPLLPHKDIAFAGLAAMLFQHDLKIAGLMTVTALLILAAHLVFGSGLLAGELRAALSRRLNRRAQS